MGLLERVNHRVSARGQQQRQAPGPQLNLDDLMAFFNGLGYPFVQTTMSQVDREQIPYSAVGAHNANSAVFSLTLARVQAFSQIRFQWTRFTGTVSQDLFGSPELAVLEKPWPGGRTPHLLSRMEIDNAIAGNAFVVRPRPDRLARLRPDQVTIVLGSQTDADFPADAPDVEVAGWYYLPRSGVPKIFLPHQVAHYAPLPDPQFTFLGMSWITAAMREIQGDSLMTEHKVRFLENAAPQPLDAKVLTPQGWVLMGQIKLGAEVIGSDGKPHRVTGVFPQGEQDICRVTFSDGARTECTLDHLWQVTCPYDRKRGVTRTMSLQQMLEGGLAWGTRQNVAKWAVPLVEPVDLPELNGPINPYLLGLLLGDGSFRGNGAGSGAASLAVANEDRFDAEHELRDVLPGEVAGSTWHSASSRDRGTWTEYYFGIHPAYYKKLPNPLTDGLRQLGLWGLRGEEKFVPDGYMLGSIHERLALLQGLLDSDGSVSSRQPNLVRFTSTSEALSRQAAELVASLGGTAKVTRLEKKNGRSQWQLTVKRLPEWIVPFRFSRKKNAYRAPSARAGRYRHIVHVEPAGRKPAQCIRVDTPDSLYVTDDYILTHNTPNLAIKFDPAVGIDAVRQFKEVMEAEHKGAWNAYKTLYLGGGAEPVAVGRDFQQLDFRQVQGKGESRLAAAAGVPPSWVGFSEGLQGSSLNAGNFTAARRRFTDGPQPLSAKILTSRGWSTMGELQRGWEVIGSDGLPHMILDVFDQGIQDVYRVGFGDGTAAECTEGHYWKTRDGERRRRGWEVLPLADICDVGLRRGERAPRWAVPLIQPVVHAAWHRHLPVDPYLLGLLLGDGTFTDTVRLTVGRDDADEMEKRVVSECLQPGLTVRREDRKDCSVLYLVGGQGTFKDRRMATMPTLMRRLGLWQVTTRQKYIPRPYLYGGLAQRTALLQGLLDSDGCVTQDGTLRFANTSPALIRDAMDLARSLGAACWVRAEYGNTQELAISRLPAGIMPVRLQRKQARLRERFGVHQWQRVKSIVSVEKVRRAETRCIKVDAADSLYVTDGFTLTHNTMSDLWTHAACALETILTPPDSGAALWYDTRGIPFMHEDGRDQAAIQSEQAQTITKLVREGFTPTSVIKAVTSNDWTALVHTGLTSVQLQPPSSGLEPMPGEAPALPAANGSSNGKAAAASNGQGGG